jgi:hypothetical protein
MFAKDHWKPPILDGVPSLIVYATEQCKSVYSLIIYYVILKSLAVKLTPPVPMMAT